MEQEFMEVWPSEDYLNKKAMSSHRINSLQNCQQKQNSLRSELGTLMVLTFSSEDGH
jgi:hypothetical protein